MTARRSDEHHGFTATAVMSLSDDPRSPVVGVGSANGSHDLICDSGWFCINVLADHQLTLADVVAGRRGLRGRERFAEGQWEFSLQGPPLLPDAQPDCRAID